jgi:hypothetical protein
MKRRYRYIAVLLLSISAAAFIVPGSLLIQQFLAIHEMKERLEESKLQTVTLERSAVKWITRNKECLIHNRYFDVRSVTEKNDTLVLEGLYDDEETEISKIVTGSSLPLEQESSSSIYKLTRFNMEEPSIQGRLIEPVLPKLSFGRPTTPLYHQPFYLVFSPPPEV